MAMSSGLLRRLDGFARDPGGNVAMLFGLAAIPLLICIGAAIDYGRALVVQERMASAADSAGLAIGSWTGLTQAELKTKAQLFFDANYKGTTMGTTSPLEVNFNGDNIVLSVKATVPTTFMRIANIDHLNMHAQATITKKERNIELVMVLDTTGSMGNGGKITALKSAAKQMVSTLFEGNDTSSTLKIGVVPFAAAVNIGKDKINSGWLDTSGYSAANATADPIPFEDLDQVAGISPLKLYSNNSFSGATSLTNREWAGCVRERSGGAGAPYELTDDAPTLATPATLWAPYFAPDEPGAASPIQGTSTSNNYLCDDPARSWSSCSGSAVYGSGTNPGTCVKNATGGAGSAFNCSSSNNNGNGWACDNVRQCLTKKYGNRSVSSTSAGPDFNCPPTAITAMTTTKATIDAAIDALTPKGSTVIPTGLLWGWRVISPTAPFTEGAAYNDDKFVKAIILLTDGENDVNQGTNTVGKSSYGAFGYAKNGHLGNVNGSNANATLDAKTLTVCNAIKAKDIRLYTIGFQVTAASQALLQSCATNPDMFYNSPTNSQLAAIFQDIAQGLSELRLAQ
jgi:Flp pilus assembly protein TadG